MANYDALKASVDKNGEVMIRLDTGEKIELHKHNVKFEDATKEIVVDSGTQTSWIGADRISYYWIHKEGLKRSSKSCHQHKTIVNGFIPSEFHREITVT